MKQLSVPEIIDLFENNFEEYERYIAAFSPEETADYISKCKDYFVRGSNLVNDLVAKTNDKVNLVNFYSENGDSIENHLQ